MTPSSVLFSCVDSIHWTKFRRAKGLAGISGPSGMLRKQGGSPVGGAQATASASGSDTESSSTGGNIDSNSDYDIESLMSCEGESSDWENSPLPNDMDELRSGLLPIRDGSMSPVNNVHVPADYVPATPIYSPYSPTSPDYSPSMSPSMSPININSDNSEITTPTNISDGIISTKDCDIFDMSNSDSDLDLEGEAETVSLVGEFINRGKLPEKLHGILIFPQPTNIHNLTWDEYPFEPCGDHCVTPERSDKSIAKFYLTHSLCLKHRSSLTNMGPWIYLTNRVSTLPKLHKSPQIAHFINLLHSKIKCDQRVNNYLVTCQLAEAQGLYNLIVRVDLYMTNNPLELRTFIHIYNVNDTVDFGDRMQYIMWRDYGEKIQEYHTRY